MPSSSRIASRRAHQILDDDGRKPERQFVDQQQFGRHISAPAIASICRSPPESSPPIALAQLGKARKELINLLLVAPAFRRAGGARPAPPDFRRR